MKEKNNYELQGRRIDYLHPDIAIIEVASEQILCASNWNDGSVGDNDDNWNVLPTL